MSAGPKQRLFVAVELPDRIRAAVEERAAPAREVLGGDVRWVPPENHHVTLAFIGWIAPERTDAVRAATARAAADAEPFSTAVTDLGRFPERGRPRVFWIGLDDASGAWARLAAVVAHHLAGFVEPAERPFRPHVTVGRARGRLQRQVMLFGTDPVVPFDVTSVALFRSYPGREGSRYEVLDRWDLGAPPPEVP